jgi:hypothetical protein
MLRLELADSNLPVDLITFVRFSTPIVTAHDANRGFPHKRRKVSLYLLGSL